MIRIANIKVPLDENGEAPLQLALKKIKADKSQVKAWRISKKSVDARDKGDVHFVMSVDVSLKNEDAYLRAAKPGTVMKVQPVAAIPVIHAEYKGLRPVVAGFGPAAAGFLTTIGPELAKTKDDGTRIVLIHKLCMVMGKNA